MKNKSKTKYKPITEEQLRWLEKGFEEGYAVAKRLYKPKRFYYVTETDPGRPFPV